MSDASAEPESSRGRRLCRILLTAVLVGAILWTAYTLYDGLRQPERIRGVWHIPVVVWALVLGGLAILQVTALVQSLRRPAPGATALRWGMILTVLFWIGFLALAQPLDLYAFETALSVVAGLFAAGVLLAPRLRRWSTGRWVRRTHVVLFQLGVTAVLLELALAGLAVIAPSPLLVNRDAEVLDRLATYAYPPGFIHLGFACNSLGYYDAELLPHDQRSRQTVLMVGDSFSASFVPHRYHFTTECERLLDVEVYNMGVAGTGPEEYLYLLSQEGLPLQPDAVVVNVFTGNDLIEARVPSLGTRWVRRWFDRGNVRLWFVPQRLLRLSAERSAEFRPGGREVDRVLASDAEIAEVYPWVQDHRLESPSFSPEAYHEIVADQVRSTSPAQPEKLAQLFTQLSAMQRLCGDIPFGVALIPGEYLVEDALWQTVTQQLEGPFIRDDAHVRVGRWLEEQGIPYLDLLPALRGGVALEDGDRHYYLSRDSHFNVRGNAAAGAALAPFLRELLR